MNRITRTALALTVALMGLAVLTNKYAYPEPPARPMQVATGTATSREPKAPAPTAPPATAAVTFPAIEPAPEPDPPHPEPAHADRSDRLPVRRTIEASAYCLRGNMANGEQAHDGAVASTVLKRGTVWRIVEGKLVGKVLTVKDTGGPRATFDVWVASCPAAFAFGRPTLVIEQVE